MYFENLTFESIDKLAEKIANFLTGNEVIALIGDLGTGKTTFVKRIAKKLGIKEIIKSPTFNIVNEYFSSGVSLFHFDVYRLNGYDDLIEIGYYEYLIKNGIKIIEWANLIEKELPKEYIEITLIYKDDFSRNIKLRYIGNLDKEGELFKYVDFRD